MHDKIIQFLSQGLLRKWDIADRTMNMNCFFPAKLLIGGAGATKHIWRQLSELTLRWFKNLEWNYSRLSIEQQKRHSLEQFGKFRADDLNSSFDEVNVVWKGWKKHRSFNHVCPQACRLRTCKHASVYQTPRKEWLTNGAYQAKFHRKKLTSGCFRRGEYNVCGIFFQRFPLQHTHAFCVSHAAKVLEPLTDWVNIGQVHAENEVVNVCLQGLSYTGESLSPLDGAPQMPQMHFKSLRWGFWVLVACCFESTLRTRAIVKPATNNVCLPLTHEEKSHERIVLRFCYFLTVISCVSKLADKRHVWFSALAMLCHEFFALVDTHLSTEQTSHSYRAPLSVILQLYADAT